MILLMLILFSSALAVEAKEIIESAKINKVNYMEPGKLYKIEPKREDRLFSDNNLHIFCDRANNKSIRYFFGNVELNLNIVVNNYEQYAGTTPEEVQKNFDERRSSFTFHLFSWKCTRFKVSPFVSSCFGMNVPTSYSLELIILPMEFFQVIAAVLSLVFHFNVLKVKLFGKSIKMILCEKERKTNSEELQKSLCHY
uniref:GOLD domain-containing protein n=1 Tax=Glossina brevipalpis TaxID=37001 RepID=A0A1A9W104_9MUSC